MSRRARHQEEAEDGERWLLTYADMMTLLVALFIVLFSISSVNKSKLETVQKSLQEAFSGKVLPGGKGIAEGSADDAKQGAVSPPFMPDPTAQQQQGTTSKSASGEERELKRVRDAVQAAAAEAGLAGKVSAKLEADGLRVRVLADQVLFSSGSADVSPRGAALLGGVAEALGRDSHDLLVEGHTDAVPIRSSRYPSNWELSSARASAVVRAFAGDGIAPGRMTAAGRADLDPVAPGSSPTARELNRRVEILLPRKARS